MKVIADKRGSGKTTKLLYASHVTGTPIVVATLQQKSFLLGMARELNIDIPDPISISTSRELDKLDCHSSVLIDNAEWVLKNILGVNIVAMTVSTETYKK